ncbi:MAG: hypothetical protein GF313_08090 [Caldithrix sp.]|nr:hypothetical protein [Caldithrix sp.]
MSGIKGLVILTRFDFIEEQFGRERLKKFIDAIDIPQKNPLIQPIGISKEYKEIYLKTIDELMLKEFFDDDTNNFLKLGHWNAKHLMPRYFQVYVENKQPGKFLQQMVVMRPLLIGLGDMKISEVDNHRYYIYINYGQPFLESVLLSERGFLEEGCRMCGANKVRSKDITSNDISIEYELSWS